MQPDAREDIDLTTIKLGVEGIARGCGCPSPAAMAVSAVSLCCITVLHTEEAILFMLCNYPSSPLSIRLLCLLLAFGSNHMRPSYHSIISLPRLLVLTLSADP